jgi:hypothetical protein
LKIPGLLFFSKDEAMLLAAFGIRKTTKFTASQLASFQNSYDENPYPSNYERRRLASENSVTENQVSVWFAHRRQKDKK